MESLGVDALRAATSDHPYRLLQKYVQAGNLILYAGCGPGRFAVELARLGATVTILDTSSVQLGLAEERLRTAGLIESVNESVEADIVELARFDDASFDVTVCYGGALTYVRDARERAAQELIRVTKLGGLLLVSVMSRYGATANLVRRPAMGSPTGHYSNSAQALARLVKSLTLDTTS